MTISSSLPKAIVRVSILSGLLLFCLVSAKAQEIKNTVGISVSYSTPSTVNLSEEGTSDWAFWSSENGNPKEQKLSGNLISDVTYLGKPPVTQDVEKAFSFSWEDGKQTTAGKNQSGGVGVSGERNGFRLVVPVGTQNKTIKLYVSAKNATALLYCKGFGYGFWSDTHKTWLTNKNGQSVRCYTINVTAPSDTCQLICEFQMLYAHSEDAAVALHAATVREYGTNAAPVVEITTPDEYQKFPEKSVVTVESKAYDPDGAIEKVVYYMGAATVEVGESSVPPYRIEIPNLSHRLYAISARAFDKTGQGADSAPRRFEMTTDQSFPPVDEPLEEYLITGPMKGKGHVGVQSMAELANGDLICVFNAGNYENSEDQTDYTIWLKKGASAWTKPVPTFDKEGLKYANPVVHVDERGKVYLFYTVVYGQAFEMSRIRMRTSDDNGKTWGPYSELSQPDYPYQTGTIVAIKPIRLANGEIMLPLNRESYDPDPKKGWFSVFAFSSDEGKTWTESEPIYSLPGNIQPAPQQMPDGSIICYFRPRGGRHEIWKSTSFDNGRTWLPLEKGGIPNPSTRSDFVFTDQGNFVIACNNDPIERSPFIVALSEDRGETWHKKKVLESGPSWYCYASVIQTRDGKIHVAYDYRRQQIKHAVIDEAWFYQKNDAK